MKISGDSNNVSQPFHPKGRRVQIFVYVPDESSLGGLDPEWHLDASQNQECERQALSWLGSAARG